MISANAISQVDAVLSGIHLFWIGPYPWIYSPGGWNIQRRKYARIKKIISKTFSSDQINLLRLDTVMKIICLQRIFNQTLRIKQIRNMISVRLSTIVSSKFIPDNFRIRK